MGIELARAFVAIRADATALARDFEAAKSQVADGMSVIGAFIKSKMDLVLGALGVGFGTSKLIAMSQESMRLAGQQIDAETKLAAVLKATGGAAGWTADQMAEHANAIESATGVDDVAIMSLQTRLAMFGNVTGETFRKVTELAADMSYVLGSVESAGITLGRALEDPAHGMNLLRRAGIMFNEQQRETIKQLVESGEIHKAQALLLKEVEKRYGGVAREVAKTDPGKLRILSAQIEDLRKKIGEKLLPAMVLWKEVQLMLTKASESAFSWVQHNKEAIKALLKVGAAIMTVVAAYKAYVIATRAAVAAAIIFQGVTGIGLIKLAAGAAIALGTYMLIDKKMEELEKSADSIGSAAEKVSESAERAAASAASVKISVFGPRTVEEKQLWDLSKLKYFEGYESYVEMWGAATKRWAEKLRDFNLDLTRTFDMFSREQQEEERAARTLFRKKGGWEGVLGLFDKVKQELSTLDLSIAREELESMREDLVLLYRQGFITGEQLKLLWDESLKKSPFGQAIEDLKELEKSVSRLRYGFSEIGLKVEEFSKLPGATEDMTARYRELLEEKNIIEKANALRKELMSPSEKVAERMAELGKIWDIVWSKTPEGPELLKRELKRIKTELEKNLVGSRDVGLFKLEAGRTGITELGSAVQDAVLRKKDEPAKITAEESKKQTGWLEKINRNLERLEALQGGLLVGPGGE